MTYYVFAPRHSNLPEFGKLFGDDSCCHSPTSLRGIPRAPYSISQERRTLRDYGYARVSAKDQSLARQLDALRDLGLSDSVIFTDKASGKDFNRPSYRRLMRRLKPGDVIFVKSIDRLGRNYQEIIEEWRSITQKKGAHIIVLDMPLLDTRNDKGEITSVFITDVVLQLLSYIAQVERENIQPTLADGIWSAIARGVWFGRRKIARPGIYLKTKHAYENGAITRKEAADRLKISITTFDNWMKEDRKALLSETD